MNSARFDVTNRSRLVILGDVVLRLTRPDEFAADSKVFTRVTFERDGEGRILALRLKGFSWNSEGRFARISL